MAKQLQLRRGTTLQNNAFIGAVGEPTLDTETGMIHIHDGQTQGGMEFIDAVVAFQKPTADNDYTWYRKYASGWVEMGGFKVINSSAQAAGAYTTATVNFPLALSIVCGWNCQAKHDRFNAGFATDLRGAAASSGSLYQVNDSSGSFSNPYVYWEVRGMAA